VETTFTGNALTSFEDSCSFPGVAGAASAYNCTTLVNPNPYDPWTGTIEASPNATRAVTRTQSAYLFDTVGFGGKWSLNLGLRFDDYSARQWAGAVDAPTLLRNDADFVNHQVGVVYKPTEHGSIYVSTGTSSNPSGNTLGDGTENISASNADLEPERNRSYEIGSKWAIHDDRVSLSTAIFHTTKANARVATEPGRGAPQQTIGEQVVDGFEIGVSGSLTRRFSLMASLTLLDSEIVDAGPVSADAGNAFPNTPRKSASVWASYAVGSRVLVGGGATFVDLRYGNTANTVWVPAYTTYDAMASIDVNARVGLQVNLQNLTDEVYFTRPYASHYAALGEGRSAMVSVDVSF
jgi:catecholate siderophore receptor